MDTQLLIEAMLSPSFYPHRPDKVDLIQTHISYVFLAGELVYKIKKAVDFGFLDFTTIERRRHFCEQEVRLNRRFSPDIYLNVVPISMRDDAYQLCDGEKVVEYAVKMRRIDENKTLNRLLQRGRAEEGMIRRVARYLAQVYAGISSDEVARPFGGIDVIGMNIKENFAQTRRYIGGPIAEEAFAAIEQWSLSFLRQKAAIFDQRVSKGYVKDCHGDLHLQHICVDGERVYAFDCIEFNERFRYGDVASDIAFLAMDLDFNGQTQLADAFVDEYIAASQDEEMIDVLPFYKVYRAYVRGKVTSFLLDDPHLDESTRGKALQQARGYFELALHYVKGERR